MVKGHDDGENCEKGENGENGENGEDGGKYEMGLKVVNLNQKSKKY